MESRVAFFVFIACFFLVAPSIAQKDPKTGKVSSSSPTAQPIVSGVTGKGGKDSKDPKDNGGSTKVKADLDLMASAPSGNYLGKYTYYGGRIWRSIRYGKAPVGALRFEASVKPDVVPGTIDTNGTTPGCMQAVSFDYIYAPKVMSEDCLFLSVTSPKKDADPRKKYPVLVYFHGGSYISGYGANSPLYDPQSFVQNGIVVVLVNYRLGAFGFLVTDTLTGNYGISDQRLALKWVRENIDAFSGNRNQITIAGQSAGAHSVLYHLKSPASQGLFHAAILDSTPFLILDSKAQAIVKADTIVSAVGCGSTTETACIKSASATAIVAAQATISSSFFQFAFVPVNDLSNQPLPSLNLFATGGLPNIPLLFAFSKDEGTSFVESVFSTTMDGNTLTAFETQLVTAAYVTNVAALYPYSTGDARDVADSIVTDAGFACPALASAEYAAGLHPSTKVFAYEYAHAFDNTFVVVTGRCGGRVCHGFDIGEVFNLAGGPGSYGYVASADEKALGKALNNVWSNFVKNKDPNVGSSISPLATFVPFKADTRKIVTVDIPGSTQGLNCAMKTDDEIQQLTADSVKDVIIALQGKNTTLTLSAATGVVRL